MAKLVKILCKGGDRLYVSIREDEVVLAREDPNDKTQQWFMDYSRASNVTDDNGKTVLFALVNKATQQVIVNMEKPRADGCVQVQLAPYADDERVHISMLWTVVEEEHGDGFHQIATLRNSTDVLDGLKGNVKEGTILGIDPSHYSYMEYVNDNQLWKFIPFRLV